MTKSPYICTSVSISSEDKKNIKPLSVAENSAYINYLLGKVSELDKQPYRVQSFAVKIRRDKEAKLKKLKAACKRANTSFSDIYWKYFDEYLNLLRQRDDSKSLADNL